MSGDMDTGGSGQSNSQDMSKRQGLIAVNDLNYILEPDLSVATNKTHKNHFFQSNEYTPTQTAICILNSGADYIDTRRSWLEFDIDFGGATTTPTSFQRPTVEFGDQALETDDDTHGSFGVHGSACNLIDSILISTRSGDELCHLFNFNLMSNMLIPLAYGREWVDGPGALMGFGGGVTNGETKRFAIPMYVLAPLFGYGRLMPSMLMSGMRIEINWAKPELAFQTIITSKAENNGTNVAVFNAVERSPRYVVKNPRFVLSSVQLSDSIQRALNELSATNGLEIVYTDYAETSYNGQNDLETVNTEIRKSCSRALKAFARVRNISYNKNRYTLGQEDAPTNAGGEVGIGLESCNDSFRGEKGFPFLEYQWQLGSLYFPQQPVTGNGSTKKCAVSAYAHMLEAVDKYHDNAPIFNTFKGIPDGGFQTGDSYYSRGMRLAPGLDSFGFGFDGQQTTLAVTLERSSMFNLAGVPVNNSRVLALRAKLSRDKTETKLNFLGGEVVTGETIRQLNIFLKYVKLARVFLNNVEVEQ
mgnify:CR=1 FL=1|tara:strand:- start:4631 stop:6220 length:1590 start_codon:yes stop_codon:yes gene_type:complete